MVSVPNDSVTASFELAVHSDISVTNFSLRYTKRNAGRGGGHGDGRPQAPQLPWTRCLAMLTSSPLFNTTLNSFVFRLF